MIKSSIETMELGNLLFGNSRGEYSIERDQYESLFRDFLDKNSFDGYGYYEHSTSPIFENEVFFLMPYYWGDDEDIAELPNFFYKPSGIEISWYKYPLRDAYCSHDLSLEKFKEMLDNCSSSMKEVE